MRALPSLRQWIVELLAVANDHARLAAQRFLTALLSNFLASLTGLGRELAPDTPSAATFRQNLRRWLGRKSWHPDLLYRGLRPQLQALVVHRPGPIPLLLEVTHLGDYWSVLQVSVPWQGRALPLHQAVLTRHASEEPQTELVERVLGWLKRHLPGPQSRYGVVLDRGFPSYALVKKLQAEQWRYVLRVNHAWGFTQRSR